MRHLHKLFLSALMTFALTTAGFAQTESGTTPPANNQTGTTTTQTGTTGDDQTGTPTTGAPATTDQVGTYMVLFKFTDQGLRDLRTSPDGVSAAEQSFQAQGATVRAFYAALAEKFNMVFLVEAPNQESVTRGAMAVAALGNARPQVVRVYTEEQFRDLAGTVQ